MEIKISIKRQVSRVNNILHGQLILWIDDCKYRVDVELEELLSVFDQSYVECRQ